MPIDWGAVFAMVLELLKSCESTQAGRQRAVRSQLRVRLAFRRALQSQGLRGLSLTRAVMDAMAQYDAATPTELDEFARMASQ
jgi:hypothetical protein